MPMRFRVNQELLAQSRAALAGHAAVYWLMGRRGRDHGSEQGKVFLREVVVRELLLDPTLDDTDRVVELRRLWDVQYTGPRPFTHVEGPGLSGGTVSTSVGRK